MILNQITVPSLDLVVSMDFYQKLGLKLIVKSLPHYLRFLCPDGHTTFSVHQVKHLPQGDGVWIYFECDDLEKKVYEFLKVGITFEDQPTDQAWLWKEVRLKDPDGNQLILYHAGENRLNPPWRVKDVG